MLTLRTRLPGAFWSGHVASWLILFSLQAEPALAEDASSLRLTLTEASREALKRRRPYHARGVTSLALHPTKPLLATGGYGERISIWSFGPDRTVDEVKRLERRVEEKRAQQRIVAALAFSDDGKFLAQTLQLEPPGVSSESQLIRIWNVDDWTLHREIRHKFHAPGAFVARFSPDGRTLATAGHDFHKHLIVLWDVQTGELKRRLSTAGCGPFSLEFSPDGESIIAADLYLQVGRFRPDRVRYQLVLWNAAAGALIKKTQRVLRISPTQKPFVGPSFFGPSVSFDGMGRVMELGHDGILHRSTTALERLPDLAERVIEQKSIDWLDLISDLHGRGDGIAIVSPGLLDVRQTGLNRRHRIPLNPRHSYGWGVMYGRPVPVSFAARSGYVALLDCESQSVRVWSPGSPDVAPDDGQEQISITSIAFSPDASLLVTTDRYGHNVIRDTQSLRPRHHLKGSVKPTFLRFLQFSPDSARLFFARESPVADDRYAVVEISAETAEQRDVYVPPDQNNWSIKQLSRDCSTLLVKGRGVLNDADALQVYDLRRSRERCRMPFADLDRDRCILALNDTGDRLYVADAKARNVSLYDVQGPSSKLLKSVPFNVPDRRVSWRWLQVAPDGMTVLLGLYGELQLLDFTTGEVRFSRKTSWLKNTSFGRAGGLLVMDRRQCLQINERSGDATVAGAVPEPVPKAMAVDPDNRFLAAASPDGMILTWKIERVGSPGR